MIKLTKIKSPEWNGNGFGTSPAIWAVKGHEYIHCWSTGNGGDWMAVDTRGENNKRVACEWKREWLLSKVAAYIERD